MQPPFRDFRHKVRLAAPVSGSDDKLPLILSAQLGVSPDHELVDVVGVDQLGRFRIVRGREGTAAADWPAGTPFTWLPEDGWTPPEPNVQNLPAALPASASRVDLRRAYRRIKIDGEILWLTAVRGARLQTFSVERGREDTTAASHSVGAPLTWLAAGAS